MPITRYGVTDPAGQGPDPVTPSPRESVLSDCIQARQEVLGVLAGIDGMPHLSNFPPAATAIGAAVDHLQQAIFTLEAAIASVSKP